MGDLGALRIRTGFLYYTGVLYKGDPMKGARGGRLLRGFKVQGLWLRALGLWVWGFGLGVPGFRFVFLGFGGV